LLIKNLQRIIRKSEHLSLKSFQDFAYTISPDSHIRTVGIEPT